jgi:hypothetical protein
MPDFARMLDEVQYSLIVVMAGIHWSAQKALLMGGFTVKLINQWLIEHAFMPLIAQTNDSLRVAVGYVFVVALLALGITYLIAAFVRLDVVNPRSAIMWYAAGLLFFTLGPSLYQGMNGFRLNLAQMMYVSVLESLNTNAGDFSSLSQVQGNDLALGALCDHFDVYLPGATGPGVIDGLDIALAYLRGHAQDVMGYPQPVFSPGCPPYFQNPNPSTWAGIGGTSIVPMDWNMSGGYFDSITSPITWDGLDETQRKVAVSMAGASQQRALTAWPLILFGLVEQIVHLLVTIAMGITFVSFGIAILFAFFKRTESIAHSLINQWIELIVQTVIIALVQALVMGFFLAGAATGSAPAIMGIGLICLVFILITLWSGVKAVWNSFNRLFNAMGQVTGNVMVSPGSAALTAAATATGGAALATSVGSNALAGMNALSNGATRAQAAGLVLGGFSTLTGAARTLTYLPGLRGTALGEAAEQFTEGAVTRQVAQHLPVVGRAAGPMVGALLLSNRDPQNTDYDRYGRAVSRAMLVPAVADTLETWTLPPGAKARRVPDSDTVQNTDTENQTADYRRLSQRMGLFTPVAPISEPTSADSTKIQQQRERSDYAAEMNSEEMEQHITDVMRSSSRAQTDGTPRSMTDSSRLEAVAARMEQSADALSNAARAQTMVGQLKVSGGTDVASVIGDVIRQVQAERTQKGAPALLGVDHLSVGSQMAQVMGVTPLQGQPPIQDNLHRFGLFTDQALRMGLTGTQAEMVVQEVKSSPDSRLSETTRTGLIEQLRTEQNLPYDSARDDVNRLDHRAQMLPHEVTAFGIVTVPPSTGEMPPPITLAPEINVQPRVDVSIQATASTSDTAYNEAIHKQAALGSSGSVIGGAS